MSNPTFKQAFAAEVFHFASKPRTTVAWHIGLIVLWTFGLGYPLFTELGLAVAPALALAPVVGIAGHLLLLTILALMRVYGSHSRYR